MLTSAGSACFTPKNTECVLRGYIVAPGARLMRAFIGEPADPKGNALTCRYCDRRARERIGAEREPLCSHHDPGGRLKPQQRNVARARARSRTRLRGLV